MMMRWLAGILLCLAAPLTAQTTAVATPVNEQAIDSFVAQVILERNLSGLQIGMLREGEMVFARGFGDAVRTGPVPVDTTIRFAIGSVSKQFTVAIVLQLAAQGKLSPTDPVSKYFKGLTRGNDITLLDLMNHVSGYPDYYPLDYLDRRMLKAIATDRLIRDYAGRPLDFEPGTRYSYSNTGFVMLGRVAELVTGTPFGRLLQDRIFTPFDMPHSVIDPKATGPGFAQGYLSFALGPLQPAPHEGEGWIGAAGGIWSTAPDLLRWDRALMDGKVVDGEWLRLMTTPRVLADTTETSYAAGLGIGRIGADTAWGHSGAVSGFAAQNIMVPATRSALVVLSNTENGVPAARLWRLAGLPFRSPPPPDSTIPKRREQAPPPVPRVKGPPAAQTAAALLGQMQAGKVDRSLLEKEFSWYLTDAKVRDAATRLAPLGAPTATKVLNTSERGGLEVTTTQFTFASARKANALMYRAPDGKVHEYLIIAP
jgi:CubicO group peptidase (beta-lactamase class C family)